MKVFDYVEVSSHPDNSGTSSQKPEQMWCCFCFVSRALNGEQLALASVMVVDTPGLRNPRHSAEERGANWSELCHNYLQERLLEHYHSHTFIHSLERYAQVTWNTARHCSIITLQICWNSLDLMWHINTSRTYMWTGTKIIEKFHCKPFLHI